MYALEHFSSVEKLCALSNFGLSVTSVQDDHRANSGAIVHTAEPRTQKFYTSFVGMNCSPNLG